MNEDDIKKEQFSSEDIGENYETTPCENDNNEFEKLQNELNELSDKFYRANADFENMKKRLEREKGVAIEYASEKFAKDLLPIIDALEEAVKVDVNDNQLAILIKDGVNRCIDIFLDVFQKNGIEVIDNEGEANPEYHNAINIVESSDHEKGQIVQVYQKGYKFKDRVLRPSMVVVAK
ncbi:MAG: nucleotide exchange factor GrpE [Campylobacter sp.]|nr:nucleotide exchange factor GrpE [Campylobacter sp.]